MGLRDVTSELDVRVGACVEYETWKADPEYREILSREFDLLAPENELKWGFLSSEREAYDFGRADELIGFAERNGMSVTGHALVWHMEKPDWVRNGEYEAGELETLLKTHIDTVAGRYSDRVDAWDVVNEAVDDDGELRDSIWLDALGEAYVEKAFEWAAERTDAALFYNDYWLVHDEAKRERAYDLLSGLVERDVPVDGVGLQMHCLGTHPDPEDVRETVERFQGLGLDVRVTEMDVAYRRGEEPDEMEERQAQYYGDVFEVCLRAGVEAITIWGVRDDTSWLRTYGEFPERFTHDPLLFDETGRKKRAYDEVERVLRDARSGKL